MVKGCATSRLSETRVRTSLCKIYKQGKLKVNFRCFLFSDEAQEAEAIQVVNAILDLREQQTVQTPAVMCKIYFTTAMLQFILGDMPKVSPYNLNRTTVVNCRVHAQTWFVHKVWKIVREQAVGCGSNGDTVRNERTSLNTVWFCPHSKLDTINVFLTDTTNHFPPYS